MKSLNVDTMVTIEGGGPAGWIIGATIGSCLVGFAVGCLIGGALILIG